MKIHLAFLVAFLLSFYGFAQNSAYLDCSTNVTLSTGYTTSQVFVLNGEQFLFSHNSNTGATSIWNLERGGKPVLEAKWSSGWTNINFYEFKGEVYFFHQKESTGAARINRLDYNSIMSGKNTGSRVYDAQWSPGWSNTKFFVYNDLVYFLHYKKSTGLARLNATHQGGDVGTKIYEKTWSKGYTNFAMTANNQDYFILYQKGQEGTCVINKINREKLQAAYRNGLQSPNLGTEAYRKKWTSGWGNTEFFSLNNEIYLFLNKPQEGTARIQKLLANGSLGPKIYDKKWTSGWTEIELYSRYGRPQLFHQKSGTGQTKICEVKLQ